MIIYSVYCVGTLTCYFWIFSVKEEWQKNSANLWISKINYSFHNLHVTFSFGVSKFRHFSNILKTFEDFWLYGSKNYLCWETFSSLLLLLRWSTWCLRFCCWHLDHVIYLKFSRKLFLLQAEQLTKWHLFQPNPTQPSKVDL